MPQPTAAQLKTLTTIANDAGADGIWLIRGADYASLATFWPGKPRGDSSTNLILEQPHQLIVLLRFPTGDDGPEGVEHR